MGAPRVATVDVAGALAGLLDAVDDLRPYPYVADTVRPPAAVIGQPELDFTDNASGFCAATWTFPITVVVARANDAEAQRDLSRLVLDIVTALHADVDGIFSIEPVDARPVPVTLGQQELPGYLLQVRVKA